MAAVYKYPVPVGDDRIVIDLPIGAEVLTFQVQRGEPFIWARVDPTAPREPRHFRFAGTGHPLGEDVGRYVGTIQINGGSLVFHLFEIERSAS